LKEALNFATRRSPARANDKHVVLDADHRFRLRLKTTVLVLLKIPILKVRSC